jgi:hypothetical protein
MLVLGQGSQLTILPRCLTIFPADEQTTSSWSAKIRGRTFHFALLKGEKQEEAGVCGVNTVFPSSLLSPYYQ